MRAEQALIETAAEVLAGAQLDAHSRLCCALSGGLDSVVLLELLRRLQPRFGYQLTAAHVDHGLSPHAGAWAEACARRCAQAGIALQVFHVEVARDHPQGLEAAARIARHGALARVACDWLVLGHHQDDQAETVLFRLLRGAGVRGAAAMRSRVAGGGGRAGLLRPLLALRRAQLLAWAQAHGLEWVEDESNTDPRFTRNAIRHRLLPAAEELFPAAAQALARAAAHFAAADELLGDLAAVDAAACGGVPLQRAALLALTPQRQANLVRWLLQREEAPAPSAAIMEEALRQLRSSDPSHPLRLPLGAWACCAYRDRVWLAPTAACVPQARDWRGEAALPWGGGQVSFIATVGAGLDGDRVACAQALRLAPRLPGLRLRLHAARPRRALRKLCQEAGVPEWLRDRLPVLWVDGDPAWVGGIGVAAEYACAPGAPGVLPVWRP